MSQIPPEPILARAFPLLLAGLIAAAVAWILATRYLFLRHGIVPGDFHVYLNAWERVREGQTPYVGTDFSPFKYSPGVLALLQFLPRDPEQAWVVFGGLSISALLIPLLIAVRYRTYHAVCSLLLGLLLAWKGILETLDYGQAELFLLGLAVISAATFESVPLLSGICLGLLPGFKLPWVLLFLPFLIAGRMEHRRRKHRFRRFLSGYLGSWFFWAAALPSLTFGAERAQLLTQEWLRLLQLQPRSLFFSDINQSLWVTALRLFPGVSPPAVLGIAAVIAGLTLGRLIARLEISSETRILRGQALAWITPWLLFTQWVNPLAWRWGSVFAIGVPFAWERVRRWHTSRFWLGAVSLLFLLWGLQQSPFLKLWGFHHWTELHSYGVVSFYWWLLIWMS